MPTGLTLTSFVDLAYRPQLISLLPFASLPVEGHSSRGFSLALVGFLLPTQHYSGDRRTSEMEIVIWWVSYIMLMAAHTRGMVMRA